ncbi:MAG: sigma-70 region 4 domain-containing protein [Holosporales bacterium]|jgi:biotin operon repressor|nr:sigma-70 region 4 domain-containing protein [Holosporales bacterium]
MHETWTNQEISKLKEGYISGKKIKDIAEELGRSSSATNKAISRILDNRRRKAKPPHSKNEFQIRSETKEPRDKQGKKKERKRSSRRKREFITIETITDYLNSKGYNVSRLPNDGYKFFSGEDDVFAVGNVPMTKMKMLLTANRIRVENREPIFAPVDLTWY